MTYDADNRLISVQFSDGTPSISYAYDGDGNRTSMTDAVGNKAYTYDTMNRLLSVNDSARNFNLSYTYDPVGNRLTMLNSKVAGATHYYYYPNNQLQSLTDTDGASVTYIYDAMNNPVNISYPNGEAATYTYVPTNHRLQSIQNLTSHGEALSSFNYVYDNNGNATNITSLSGATAYTYDDLNQLTSALYPSSASGSVSYVYDGVGNQTVVTQNGVSKTKTYNAGNELLSYNGFTFNYDRAGNMVAKGAYPIGISYVWDAMNRLVRISTSSLGTTKGITYVYDGDGHRVQKTTAQGTTNYFYDGSSEVAETDGAGNVLNSFDPGISVTDQQGNKLYYLYNGHGDVAGLMDVNQNLVQSYEYDAFGNTLGVQKDSNHSRYVGLGGVYSDDDASLQNMWNRWYDPTLGRFISRDPIGMAGGMNLYVYVRNNPIKFTDFHGLCVDSSSPYVFSSSTSEAAQNTVAPVDPLAIDSNATPDPESQGVYIGLDASVLGVNASHELIGTNDVSDKTSIVPSVIGADIFVHVGFNNSVMFQNMGPVNSVGFGIGKHGGVVLDPNGIAVGFGASWPPIPISMSANTSSLTP
jgi:RHS repeat-associated protein